MAWKIYGMRIMISQSLKVRMTLLLKCAQRVYVVQSRHDTKMGPYIQGMPFGHEFSGVVDAIGSDVTHVKVGDKVTGCPAIPCYQCEYCLKGEYARCEKLFVIGSYEPGSFAEYVKLPAQNVLKVPDNVDYIEAAMVEPSAVVAHGFYKSNIQPGMTVAVMGCGSIGLLAIQWARIFGAAHIIAIDIDAHKLDIASSLGAHQTINSKEEDLEKFIENHYANQIDLAIESSGAKVTIGQILTLPKKVARWYYSEYHMMILRLIAFILKNSA